MQERTEKEYCLKKVKIEQCWSNDMLEIETHDVKEILNTDTGILEIAQQPEFIKIECKNEYENVSSKNYAVFTQRTDFFKTEHKENCIEIPSLQSGCIKCDPDENLNTNPIATFSYDFIKYESSDYNNVSNVTEQSIKEDNFSLNSDYVDTSILFRQSNISQQSNLKCKLCKKKFKTKNCLLKHVRNTHSVSNEFKCKKCCKTYKNKSALNRHSYCHLDSDGFQCELCGKNFKYKGFLVAHIRNVHSDTKDFECEKCGKKCKNKYTFRSHINTHRDSNDFVCQICEKTFKCKRYLNSHMQTHSDPNNFIKCEECGKEFKYKCFLAAHMRNVHRDSILVECANCGKAFKNKNYLLNHIRKVHEIFKSQAYQCDKCDKIFKSKYLLHNHMYIHRKTNDFVCGVCGKAFKCKSYLSDHNRNYHRDSYICKCQQCGKTYNDIILFRKHKNTHKKLKASI